MFYLAGLIGFVITTVLTMAGVGAAFVMIPILTSMNVDLHTAMATALLLNAVGMTIASVSFVRNGLVLWKIVIPMTIIASSIAPLGVLASRSIDRSILLWLFVGFLLFASAMMFWYKAKTHSTQRPASEQIATGAVIGGIAGFIGGLLGVGGGNIIVPALVAKGVDAKRASTSASFTVIFASLSGFFSHVAVARMNVQLLAILLAATAGGALLGSWLLAKKAQAATVKKLIAIVLLLIAGKMVFMDLKVGSKLFKQSPATASAYTVKSRNR